MTIALKLLLGGAFYYIAAQVSYTAPADDGLQPYLFRSILTSALAYPPTAMIYINEHYFVRYAFCASSSIFAYCSLASIGAAILTFPQNPNTHEKNT